VCDGFVVFQKDMNRNNDLFQQKLDALNLQHKKDCVISEKLGLSSFNSGLQIIRDENGWRENEKIIEYIWTVEIDKSFVGSMTLFSLKFEDNRFRNYENQEELVQGIFSFKPNGEIEENYIEVNSTDFRDSIKGINKFELFEIDNSITLDGISYNFQIKTQNKNTEITLHNPNSEFWKSWENEILKVGQTLAYNSEKQSFISFFE
jgi:hypothetical protein